MTPGDFQYICDLLKERSGLALTADKVYLVESRLLPVARKNDFGSLDELIAEIRGKKDEKLLTLVTEAMTTNESFFYRDKKPFELFEEVILPHILETRRATRKFRLWSAAASTGQEPYSLAMILKEMAPKLTGWNNEIVGTDLSEAVLERARNGVYTQFEVQRGLPIQMLVKYFTQEGEQWQIKPEIRSMVRYRPFNLLDDFRPLGQFDVVYCRNVLIYFDPETKKNVLERIAAQMPEDGILLLGAAETVIGVTDAFRPVPGMRGLYARNPALIGEAARAPAA